MHKAGQPDKVRWGAGLIRTGHLYGHSQRYERGDDYWNQRVQEVAKPLVAQFTPPVKGSEITISQRIGRDVTGRLESSSADSVTIDGKPYQRTDLTQATCAQLFADDWAIATAVQQVITERQEYEAKEDAKPATPEPNKTEGKEDVKQTKTAPKKQAPKQNVNPKKKK